MFENDQYFTMPWDTAHWLDRVMEKLREKGQSTSYFKRIIKRTNRFHTMFSIGKGRSEYMQLAESEGVKAMETVTFATTRFFNSAFRQFEMVHKNYVQLVDAYMKFREDEDDDCDETKYEVMKFFLYLFLWLPYCTLKKTCLNF